MKVRQSASCQKKQIFPSLCHQGEWDVLLSCRMAKSEGSQGYKGKLACVELTNYHFLNRELVTNEQCSNAAQHLDRYHKTYEYCIVRKRRGTVQWICMLMKS